jgi:hypothetical protein
MEDLENPNNPDPQGGPWGPHRVRSHHQPGDAIELLLSSNESNQVVADAAGGTETSASGQIETAVGCLPSYLPVGSPGQRLW